MDPMIALLLLPPVVAASVAGYAALKRRWSNHELELRCAFAETEAVKSRDALKSRTGALDMLHGEVSRVGTALTALEQQVASLKSQLSLSSTARR